MRELMGEFAYSEGDVGSSSNQDESQNRVNTNTPSVSSMAVSAKKGRVSNAGSLMGFQ